MLSKLKFILIMVPALTLVQFAGAGSGVLDHWKTLDKKLTSVLDLLNQEKKAPDSSWNPFRDTKASLGRDIKDLVDEVIEILDISILTEIKARINQSQRNIAELRQAVVDLETEKLMAPDKSEPWEVWKKDAEDYEEKIRELKRRIKENSDAIEQDKELLRRALEKTGLALEEEQIDMLVYSVTGDDDVQMIAVYENVRIITEKLKDLMVESEERIETAKKYYGMYTVLLRVLVLLQKEYIRRIEEVYLPTIEEVIEENEKLMDQTRAGIRTAEARRRRLYAENLAAQEITAQAAGLYKKVLGRNRERVEHSVQGTIKELDLAFNTYQTVSNASALLNIIRESEKMFNALSSLQAPDLIRFENRELKREFQTLTLKMRGRGGSD